MIVWLEGEQQRVDWFGWAQYRTSRDVTLRISHSLAMAALLAPVAIMAVVLALAYRFAGFGHGDQCRQCGYSMIGLPTPRCPECGYVAEDRGNGNPADEVRYP
jgi:hypothetical protein